MSCRIGANSLCKVSRTKGLNLSGFMPTSSLSMSSAALLIAGILRWGLSWNGGLAPESCKSCSYFLSRDFKLMGFGAKH